MTWLRNAQIALTSLCGVFLVLAAALGQNALAYLSVACGSYFALASTWDSLKQRELDVNFLMVFAAAGAIVAGRPLEAAGLLFLFSLSSTLEVFAMGRTRSAIEGLVRLRPSEALRLRNGSEERVPVESLEVGDRVIVPAFEQIPSDGLVVEGSGHVNQSSMTGESRPVSKTIGDAVISGTQNLEALLTIEVSTRVEDSTLSRIVELVRDAQENKASGERISSWFGQRYTWFVILAFGCSIAFHMILPPSLPSSGYTSVWDYALYKSLTLLVGLSPCALVISTPATTLSGLACAARRGILVRGGRFLELVGRAKTIVFDKTGTLTVGKPSVAEICLCDESPVAVGVHAACTNEEVCWRGEGEISQEALKVLSAAASVEQYSDHPIGEAIVRAAKERSLDLPEGESHHVYPGKGVEAFLDGRRVVVGTRKLLEQLGLQPSDEFLSHASDMSSKGMSVALVSYDTHFAAIGLRDTPRENAAAIILELKGLGVPNAMMLSGDNEVTARAVAAEVGITDVEAGLLPDQKEEIVRKLAQSNGGVIMVGDGVNDAPSLAAATVGIAMGGLGSDIALNAADIVLMHDDLARIPEVVRLGRRTNQIIRTNLTFASAVIIALATASLVTVLPLPIAVLGHEGSTVLVILNGLRLLRAPHGA